MSKVEALVPFGVCAGCQRMRELFYQSWRSNLMYCSESCCETKERVYL